MPSAVVNGARNEDHEVVLTGLSGRLPESDSIEEFAQKLFDGVDLITADDRRWTPGNIFIQLPLSYAVRSEETVAEGRINPI